MVPSKACVQCGEIYYKKTTTSKRSWSKQRFCSPRCKSEPQKGKPPWNKGLKLGSNPTMLPCRICGQPTKYHGTKSHPHYGKVHCGRDECRGMSRQIKNDRIQASLKDHVQKHGPFGGSWLGVSTVSREERLLEPWLESLGWESQYQFNTGVHTNKLPRFYKLDFALPSMRLYIEVDGKSHRSPERREKDAYRDALMQRRGWTGLRIPAKAVRNDPASVKRRILDWLNVQRQVS